MSWDTGSKLPNDIVGDGLQVPKGENITRCQLQNINGTDIRKGGGWHHTCEHYKRMQVDLSGIVEHKLDTTKTFVTKRLHEDAAKVFGGRQFVKLNPHSTPVKAAKHRKPGGMLQMVTGATVGRVKQYDNDPYGRWTATILHRVNQPPITYITTYQAVTTSPRSAGSTTYVTQLYSQHATEGRVDPHKIRKHHVADLVQYVKQQQQKGHSIILNGDFNEDLGETDGMSLLCTTCHMRDPILTNHGATEFATYSRGHKVIDYILISEDLLPAVRRCGYEPFNNNIISDHRGAYVDFDTDLLFGDPLPLPSIAARGLNSKRPHQIEPYFKFKQKHLEDHNWHEKLKTLQSAMDANERNDALAEDLYSRLLISCIYAGKRLPTYAPAPFSPELVKLRNKKDYLRLLHTHYTTSFDQTAEMDELKHKLGSQGIEIPATPELCRQALATATKEFHAALKKELKNKPMRKAHLQNCLETAEAQGNSKRAKAIRGMQKAEAVSQVFTKLRAARGKMPNGGLDSLLVPAEEGADPKQCTDWRRVEEPEEIRILLEERNRKHFGQSKNCNLTSPPTDFTMDFTGACARADAILEGTYPTDNLDEYTKILLESLKYVSEPDKIQPYLTKEAFLAKVKVWDERTSTSPMSQMHLGHLKAYKAEHSLDPESQEAQDLEAIRSSILSGHVLLLNYCIKFGHSYKQWQKIVNAMLEKEPGNPKIHRLRVIHLYEVDFNLLLSIKWRDLLHHACDNGFVNESQFGSQAGKEALDAVFLRELEYEFSRLTRTKTIHFDNDATSCYDRIPCFLANVVSRKYGMHKQVCIVQGKTLEQAKYHLKTKLGISPEYVTHSFECPWFGTGQGSGNSPGYWLLICSTLFDNYEAKATGATYESPDKTISITIYIIGYVDDSRNSANAFPNDSTTSMDTLVQQATKDSQLWHDILQSSNQELELTKCGYHAIEYQFAEDGKPSLIDKPEIPPIQVTNSEGNTLSIDQWKNSKATRYLGCHECPANKTQHYESIVKKCKDFKRVLQSCYLTSREATIFYWSIYRPSVSYSLPICHFTFQQLEKAHRATEIAFMQRMGFNKNMSKAVMHGPRFMGGEALFHFYDDQGYGQVRMFLKFWRTPTTKPGRMLHATYAWAQYCAGVGWPIFSIPGTKLKYLESAWLASLRNYLASIDASIEVGNPFIPPRQRVNDVFIMDIALEMGRFKPVELRRINYCRLYLGVTLLSEITTAGGNRLEPSMYWGNPPAHISTATYHKVTQSNPNAKAWKAWRKLLHLIAHRHSLLLKHDYLGSWLVPLEKQTRQWPVLYDPESNEMFCQSNHGWTAHEMLHYDYDKTPATHVEVPPPTAVPCDFSSNQYTIRMHRYEKREIQQQPAPSPTIQGRVTQLEEWEQQLLTGLEFKVPEHEVWNAINNNQCIFASDGSAPPLKGSFAWVLSDLQGNRLAQCSGPVFGYKIGSYRAEGYGILSVLRFLLRMQELHQLAQPPKHSLRSDSKSMLQVIHKHKGYAKIFPNATMASDWDVVAEITSTLKQLPEILTPEMQHIKGHQDRQKPYEELPLSAQLNCDADALANTWINNNPDFDHSRVPILPTSGCQIHLASGTLTHNHKQELKLARTVKDMKAHYCSKFEWTTETCEDVDWSNHGRALKRLDKHRKSLVKYLNSATPVGVRVHRYDKKYPEECPSCNYPQEDSHHLIHCPKRKEQRETWYKAILDYTTKTDTYPPLQDLIMSAMRARLDDQPDTAIIVPPEVQVEAQAQETIGWRHLFKGRLSSTWKSRQEQHLGTRRADDNNGDTWMTGLIQVMLQQWFDLWKARNADRHGNDWETTLAAQKRQAIREVTQIYEQYKDNIEAEHNWLFDVPLLTRIQQPTDSLRQWINSWHPLIKESYQTRLETG